jgi:NitT/TauT family transport system ATP-binding protein
MPQEPFLHLLSDNMDAEEAERVLRVTIEWGRHGEVFGYDYRTGVIRLPDEREAAGAA